MHLKKWLYTRQLYYFKDAYNPIFDFIERFYNPIRLHSSVEDSSPIASKNKKKNEKTL